MGEMVLDNTTVPGLSAGDLRFVQMSRYGNEGGNAYTFISDEEFPVSLAGSALLYTSFTGVHSVRLMDRTPARGVDYNSPITSSNLPPIIRGLQACADFNPATHWAACAGLRSSSKSSTSAS